MLCAAYLVFYLAFNNVILARKQSLSWSKWIWGGLQLENKVYKVRMLPNFDNKFIQIKSYWKDLFYASTL